MQRFVSLLLALPTGAFIADLLELFASGGVARVDLKHFVELQLRFGQSPFRHALLGSAQRLCNVAATLEGGLRLTKEFSCRLVSRIELQRGLDFGLGFLDLSARKKPSRILHTRLQLRNDLLAPNF